MSESNYRKQVRKLLAQRIPPDALMATKFSNLRAAVCEAAGSADPAEGGERTLEELNVEIDYFGEASSYTAWVRDTLISERNNLERNQA